MYVDPNKFFFYRIALTQFTCFIKLNGARQMQASDLLVCEIVAAAVFKYKFFPWDHQNGN